MATNFPNSLDIFTNISSPKITTTETEVGGRTHSEFHNDINDAVEALQAKVGVDSSTVNTSHTYKISQLEASFPSSSVDNEMVLFQGTNGKILKRSNLNGIVKSTNGVVIQATPAVDYVLPGVIGVSGLSMSSGYLLGRGTTGAGAIEEIFLGAGLSLSAGGVLSVQSTSASVFHSTSQTSSITPNTWTVLNWDSERYDNGYHDTVVNNSRFNVSAGTYEIHVSFAFQSTTSGNTNYVQIRKNGTQILERSLRDSGGPGSQEYYFDVSIKDVASSNSYYEVFIKSSQSSNMTVLQQSALNAFEITRI